MHDMHEMHYMSGDAHSPQNHGVMIGPGHGLKEDARQLHKSNATGDVMLTDGSCTLDLIAHAQHMQQCGAVWPDILVVQMSVGSMAYSYPPQDQQRQDHQGNAGHGAGKDNDIDIHGLQAQQVRERTW